MRTVRFDYVGSVRRQYKVNRPYTAAKCALSWFISQKNLLLSLLVLSCSGLWAQYGLGTNTPNAQAALHIESSSHGVLIPNVALTSSTVFSLGGLTAATADHESMLVYNTSTATTNGLTGSGYYFWSGGTTGSWKRLQVGTDAATAATTSHWNVAGTTTSASSNTDDIVQLGDVTVGSETDRHTLSFTGALYGGRIKEYTGSGDLVWDDDVFVMLLTSQSDPPLTGIYLPDASQNINRIVSLVNESPRSVQFGGDRADTHIPKDYSALYRFTAALFMSDGATWQQVFAR